MPLNLKDLGLALGGLAGNNGTAYEAGAAGAAVNLVSRGQTAVRSAMNKAGRALGSVLGEAIPAQIAAGAAETGGAAVSAFEQKYAGYSVSQILTYGALALVVVGVAWILLRGRSRK